MANTVLLPQIGISEESAILAQWYVAVGDSVKVGDNLFSLETGKSAFDVESEFEGTVLALIGAEGDELPIKAPVCVIGQPGEAFEVPGAEEVQKEVQEQPKAELQKPVIVQAEAASPASGEHIGVSPRARALATKAGIDPIYASPTGAEGRIIERDVRTLIENPVVAAEKVSARSVETALATVPAAVEYTDKPLTTIRKLIAENMYRSISESAQLTHTASFDATAIMEYRKLCKASPDMAGVTLGDMVLYAVSRTLPEFPDLNAWFMGSSIRHFSAVNLAVAVDTDRGLMVPVIFGADSRSLLEISNATKQLAGEARGGKINPDLLSGGSFTVSNLGSYGIESFTPIINHPQTGILGVNTIAERVRTANGTITTYPAMSLSLTYDHRALDGAPASRFLQVLCKNLENFTLMLGK